MMQAIGKPCSCIGAPIEPGPTELGQIYQCGRCGKLWSRCNIGGTVLPMPERGVSCAQKQRTA